MSRTPAGDDDAVAAVGRAFREHGATVLANLVRHVGDFSLAEDAVQDALTSAVVAWPRDGVPASPAAWITTVARRRAIDRVRRMRSQDERTRRLAELPVDLDAHEPPDTLGPAVAIDDRLRLIFTCCHPALDLPARVALTLRAVGGLTTGEIARAFVVAEPAMGKRIVRAKRRIEDAGVAYEVPADRELPRRLGSVLKVIYLIFNEGYAATRGDDLVRPDLCREAISLASLLVDVMPKEAEAWGLLALLLLHDARRDARTSHTGRYVSLLQQDRSRWDVSRISQGTLALDRAMQLRSPGPYQLHAAISATVCATVDPATTDWSGVAALYAGLRRLDPSPVVAVQHAAAVGFASGAAEALTLLGPLLDEPRLRRYQPLHAAHADFLARVGDAGAAAEAFDRAIALTENAVERAELEVRRRALGVDRSVAA